MKCAVAVVRSVLHLSVLRIWSQSSTGIRDVLICDRLKISTFVAGVRNRANQMCRKFLLNGKTPLGTVCVFTTPVLSSRRQNARGGCEITVNRISKTGYISRVQCVTRHVVRCR